MSRPLSLLLLQHCHNFANPIGEFLEKSLEFGGFGGGGGVGARRDGREATFDGFGGGAELFKGEGKVVAVAEGEAKVEMSKKGVKEEMER